MKQITFFSTNKKEICNNVKRKSNYEKLLSVKVSIENEVSNLDNSSAKKNFGLMLKYYNKIKMKDRLTVVLNNCFEG